MTTWTYEGTRKGYAKMWDSIAIKGGADHDNATRFANTIIANEQKYRAVEAATGWPWYFVGSLHMRESSCNFAGILHNGEKIIGKGRKTRLVPKGRGPFKTWPEAAIDAIGLKRSLAAGREWCPALMGFIAERFNGLGYVDKGVNSPYCWAGSNHEQVGKYISDGKFDRKADDTQIGVMTVLKRLAELRPDIAAALAENHKSPMSNTKKIVLGTVAGGGAVGSAAASDSSSMLDQLQPVIDVFSNHGTSIGFVFTVAIIVGVVGWHFYEKYQERNG